MCDHNIISMAAHILTGHRSDYVWNCAMVSIFAGSSGTWMWWIRSMLPSPSVHPSGVTFPFLYRIGCSSNWVFLYLDCCTLMRWLLHTRMISYQRILRHLSVVQLPFSNHLLFSLIVLKGSKGGKHNVGCLGLFICIHIWLWESNWIFFCWNPVLDPSWSSSWKSLPHHRWWLYQFLWVRYN